MATTTRTKKTNGNTNDTATATPTATDYASLGSKAEAIRKAHEQNPTWTQKKIAVELTKVGVDVTPGRVSAVLRGPSNGSGGKVDVATIKRASAFAGEFKDIEAALNAIEQVGRFIDDCGNSHKAKAALETYQAVAAAMQ